MSLFAVDRIYIERKNINVMYPIKVRELIFAVSIILDPATSRIFLIIVITLKVVEPSVCIILIVEKLIMQLKIPFKSVHSIPFVILSFFSISVTSSSINGNVLIALHLEYAANIANGLYPFTIFWVKTSLIPSAKLDVNIYMTPIMSKFISPYDTSTPPNDSPVIDIRVPVFGISVLDIHNAITTMMGVSAFNI